MNELLIYFVVFFTSLSFAIWSIGRAAYRANLDTQALARRRSRRER